MLARRLLRSPAPGVLGILLAAGTALPAGAAITGVCPDGSIFIVPRDELIPCRGAKKVEPDEVPPMRPEYLPRPYTWQVYNEQTNPNNAYNLIDQARQVRALRDGQLPAVGAGPDAGTEAGTPQAATRPVQTRQERPASGPLDLGLSDGEMRDLYFILELRQQNAPAQFVKEDAAGNELMIVSMAHSTAFGERFVQAWGDRGRIHGPVLLFSAIARDDEPFYANLTFSQGPMAFQPRVDDPLQFGVIQGRLGPMPRNSAVLGYVVLPENIDLSSPIDIYWNDRRIEAVFEPLG